ncbi:flagellar hook-associated protein FlgK [Blastococcus sp. TF02A-26]|uniref:flagellar hook-associated protein FlgK n=1 Tax=Blastococcus sp. TF02A-26 TaxID=2250577 RepID=UPI000DE8F4F3|nr:flagellar hook-associated protein FlgK [Blastococcus sp. TF02A-26]RBY86051.1 flagellar hook-associated protein FlgK [Blastococcus sp. TF02A-26]
MSTFGGLARASTALWAAQRGLDVTGQNISNVNTDGYSRQRVEQSSMNGSTVPAIHAVSDGIGSGVDSDSVIRIRDAFLEARGRLETATTARLTVESQAYTQVEQAFREPGNTGIQKMMADVWSGFSDVANNPTEKNLAARSQAIERLKTLAAGIRTTATSLDKQWEDTHASLESMVADVNATTTSIADLNQKIKLGTLSGIPVNELSDERDALVFKLSQQVGATATRGHDGVLNVSVGGTSLVSGNTAIAVRLAGATAPGDAITDPPRLVTDPGGSTLSVGGTAEGQVKVMTTIVPRYRAELDTIAADLAAAVNTQHKAGLDLDGQPGVDLLGPSTGSTITAATITVTMTDPRGIAAARALPGGVFTANGDNADAMFKLSLAAGGVDSTYRKMIVGLGVNSAVAERDLAVQTVVRDQVDAARESVSGVNLDEEMTNMMSYQHAYSAAARLVTAIDEALNTLINGMGVVGR